ncbi:MAG: hypothetical protein ACXWDL_02205 [Nocardioides sp.]
MNDDLTTRLRQQLHDQAADWQAAPLTLDSVRGRARSIQRTRRVVTGAAAVAVAAVVVPSVMLLGSDLGADREIPPAGPSPTRVIDTDLPTERADGTVPLEVLDAPAGDATAAGYIVIADNQLRTGEGALDLPAGTQQLRRFGDGWIGLRATTNPENTGYSMFRADADLRVTVEASAMGLVVDLAGQQAAWVEVDGDQWSLAAGTPEAESWRTPVQPNTQPVGFQTDGSVVLQTLDHETGESTFAVADGQRSVPFGEGLLRLEATSEVTDAVSALASYDDPVGTACFTVLDPVGDTTVFDTCDFQPVAFSPDGTLVAGFMAYADAIGSPELAILDAATGEPLVQWSSGRDRNPASVQEVAWEDADTVLATVTESGQQTVVRGELDGTLEQVAEPTQVNMSVAYWLPGAPANLG